MTLAKVALVTGGAAGMGKATSLRLAHEGRRVAVLDIDAAGADAVAQEIVAEGGKAIAIAADISDRHQVREGLAQVRSELGPVTILINNVGIENFCPFPDLDDTMWDRLMAVNLKGFYIVTQEVLPDMEAAAWGRIVNLSSFGAQTGAPDMTLYTATKGGIIAMTRSLAVELGRKGITVNAVSPGFIDTPMARRAIDGGKFPVPFEQIVATYPIPRLGLPDEVAAACCFFAGEDASYVTAQLLGVNGGTAV